MGVGGTNPNEAQFEALNKVKWTSLQIKKEVFVKNYQRSDGIPGWNRDDGWRDHDREWCDCNATWKEREGDKYRYIPPYECENPKEPMVDSENVWTKDMLSRILNKVEGSHKVLKEIKEDVSTRNQTVTSISFSIKNLETPKPKAKRKVA